MTHSVPGPSAEWPPGKLLLDDFRVERLLGRGGMGAVYLVKSRSTGSMFALKRILPQYFEKDQQRQAFIDELKNWIDLPVHPNIVPCHFFRTIEGGIAIFAGHAEGGSLKDWIAADAGRSRRLYAGGPSEALKRILDISIQFAWGLEAIHARGLVHGDVKPANALMTRSGVPMVADFGLSRAISLVGRTSTSGGRRASAGATCQGGTPAYWSPEQSRGSRVTSKTDIWSWGLSVLHMFQGDVTWMSGADALEALEAYVRQAGEAGSTCPPVPIPAGVADVLRKCVQEDVSMRWDSMAEAARTLIAVCAKPWGPYNRRMPAVESGGGTAASDRRTQFGGSWADPRKWLRKALGLGGGDPREDDAPPPPPGASRKALAIADLAVYEQAFVIYDRLIASGRADVRQDFTVLCAEKAWVHWFLDDGPGFLAMYDRAIAIRERLIQEGRRELSEGLASCYLNKANAVGKLGDHRSAARLYDLATALYERLVMKEGRKELSDNLAKGYMNKANSMRSLDDHRAALKYFDRSIAFLEPLVMREGRHELSNALAMCYANKAGELNLLGDHRSAVGLLDRASGILERLVGPEGRKELSNDLAGCYNNKAGAVRALGDPRAAAQLCDRAIAIRERLVNQEGRKELSNDLASCYNNKAGAVKSLGDPRAAVQLYDRAIAIRERLVNQEGRKELSNDLAACYNNKAFAVGALGDPLAAVQLYDRAIAIRESLVNEEGRKELADDLALCYGKKADSIAALGDQRCALRLYDRAIAILEPMVAGKGRKDLAGSLKKFQAARKSLAGKAGGT